MSELIERLFSMLRIPPEHHGFVISLAAIALSGYAIYAVLSVVQGN